MPTKMTALNACGPGGVFAAQRPKPPPYVIFHDATLRAIAQMNPAHLEEMNHIPGIGPREVESYGEAVIDLLHGGTSADAGRRTACHVCILTLRASHTTYCKRTLEANGSYSVERIRKDRIHSWHVPITFSRGRPLCSMSIWGARPSKSAVCVWER